MSMKQFDKYYIETIKQLNMIREHDQLPYSKDSLLLLSSRMDLTQLKLVEEATLKKQPVVVITSVDMKPRIKNGLLQLLTEYEDNSYNPNLRLFRVLRVIGFIFIVLGLLLVGLFTVLKLMKNPLVEDRSILLLFVPLLVTYFGFLFVDFMDRMMLKRYKLRPNLELIVLKSKNFRTSESLMILDNQHGYFESKRSLQEFEMNEQTIERLTEMIIMARGFDKKDRLSKDKTPIWLLRD